MINNILLLIGIMFLFSCKEKHKNNLELKYKKDNNELYLDFENNLGHDIVFLTPNTLHFSDIITKRATSVQEGNGFPPITIYAIIEPNKSSKFYQKKLDSIHDSYLVEIGNSAFISDERSGDGNSVFYLRTNESIKVKYKLIIKQSAPYYDYSSKYKQNYYPYDKVLKGEYPEGEYLRRFSKLNFGKAKFVTQPIIEDSLFLRLSEKDVTN